MRMHVRITATAAVLLALATGGARLANAGDRTFSSVVKLVQSQYNGKRQGMPWMGFARFAVKVVKPAGVKNFKVVVLKDLDLSPQGGGPEFHASVASRVNPVWQPLVRYHSQVKHQWTYVYAQHLSSEVKLLIVTLQQREAYLVQLKFSPEKLIKFMEEPSILGIPLKGQDQSGQPTSTTTN